MRFPYCRGHSSLKEYKIYAVLNVEFGICYSPKWFKLMSGLVWFFYNNALVATYTSSFLTTPMLYNYASATYFSATKTAPRALML